MNIHLWSEEEYQAIKAQLDRIETSIARMEQNVATQETKIMAEIDDMIAEVNDVKATEDRAVLTINRMADQINGIVQNATDLATLKQQIADQTAAMKANAQPLADAIAANPGPTPNP